MIYEYCYFTYCSFSFYILFIFQKLRQQICLTGTNTVQVPLCPDIHVNDLVNNEKKNKSDSSM